MNSNRKNKCRRTAALLLLCVLTAALSSFASTTASASGIGSGAAVISHGVTMIRSALLGETITFSEADFKRALCVSSLKGIRVLSLPASTDGVLMLDGRRVRAGQSVSRRNLGKLSFIPENDEIRETSFLFAAEGYSENEISCFLRFADRINYAPKASSETSVTTQKNIGYYGRLAATDPEGDLLEYIAVRPASHGRVTISKNGGDYVYTPDIGYTGSDGFVYVVRDEYGNYTAPISVSIEVNERMCEAEYVDMKNSPDYNAAVAMTALNVMAGKLVGDDLYFEPEATVTRAEFVAMAMKAKGVRRDASLAQTYFDDNDEIPPSLVGYIATAQKIGIIDPTFENGKLLFSPNRPITRYEAAAVLADLTAQQSEAELTVFAVESEVPLYARAGVYAMLAGGIFTSADDLSANVTKADAARYLYRMLGKR